MKFKVLLYAEIPGGKVLLCIIWKTNHYDVVKNQMQQCPFDREIPTNLEREIDFGFELKWLGSCLVHNMESKFYSILS